MAERLSRSAIKKLGSRLAKAEVPTPEDLASLSNVQREHSAALDAVLQVVREVTKGPNLGWTVHVTHRVKTLDTLIEKLRRGTALSTMQDIVGIRAVGNFTLTGQNATVQALVSGFPGARVEDRRLNPNHGYRAVHVVPTISGHPVEIQVRTGLQHAWANATEQLADGWGRGIRYGGIPTGGASADETLRRGVAFLHWLKASECIAELEGALDRTHATLRGAAVEVLRQTPGLSLEDAVNQVFATNLDAHADVNAAAAKLVRVVRDGGLEIGTALGAALDAQGYGVKR